MQVLRLLPPLAVMVLIFLLSHQSGDDLPPLFPFFDKIAHFFIYGLLAATAIGACPPEMRQRRPGAVVLCTVLCCLVYGISDEFHQSFIPGRSPSLADVVADTFGALSVALAWLLLPFWPGRRAVPGDRVE
jgi:VanZ family protein